MQKKNIFKKNYNKIVLSITNGIESFFNFFKENFFNKKGYTKNFKTIDKKIFIAIAILFISFISYFVIPAFYDKNKVKTLIESQILDKYNLEVKLDENLKYGIFPKPHFYSENVIINYNATEIAISKNTRISIFTKNFFSLDNLKIKNCDFKKTDFKINFSNFMFFVDILNHIKTDKKINFLNSKLFYLDKDDNIIFLSNIKNLNYFYDDNFLQNLNSKFSVFNIPISLNTQHNILTKKVFNEINSYPLRLNLQNNFNYSDEKLNGLLNLTIINESVKINYNLTDNHLKFNTNDNKVEGGINIKPFFLLTNLKINQIDLNEIFKDNSILVNLLKSQILNNRNLNGKINVVVDNFKGQNFLNKVKFSILFEEGDIIIQNFKTTFKEAVTINISNTQLIIDNNDLSFVGKISLDFVDLTNFYSHYQINRNYRKNFKNINFGFLLNLNNDFLEIDSFKIDEKSNEKIDKFFNNLNSKKENLLNKIIFRNTVKDFFKSFN